MGLQVGLAKRLGFISNIAIATYQTSCPNLCWEACSSPWSDLRKSNTKNRGLKQSGPESGAVNRVLLYMGGSLNGGTPKTPQNDHF